MSLHHPDLYFFLCLLAGFAAFLAIEMHPEILQAETPGSPAARRAPV